MNRGEHVDVIAGVRLTGTERVDPFGDEPVDVHLAGGRIADIAPAGALPRRGAVLDGDGAWLIPGLWDHHLHTVPWALTSQRQPLGTARSAAEAARTMASASSQPDGRRVGAGFRDALWPDAPSRALLDAVTGTVPTYLFNADLHSMWLNTAALRREGLPLDDDGVLREALAFEVGRRLSDVEPATGDALVRSALERAGARGIVGIVDLDMAWNAGAWARRLADGFDATRVSFGVYTEMLERAIAEGLATGDAIDEAGLVRMGPFKVISDGSLGTRTAACTHPYPGDPHNHGTLNVTPDELVELMTRATGAGIASAVHAIGDVAVSHALDVFARTGAFGTIEHAQLVAHADIPRFGRLGVGASVQPEHALDDRDLTDTLWAAQTAQPYPLRALAEGGANLLFGSDAPVSVLDPWVAMAAAVERTRDGREPWQPAQRVDAATALAASTAGGSLTGCALEPGDVADLVLCDRDPLVSVHLRETHVHATMIAARLTHV